MTITTVIITIRHDKGKQRLLVTSLSGLTGAIQQVCAAENCPQTAIIALRVIAQQHIT